MGLHDRDFIRLSEGEGEVSQELSHLRTFSGPPKEFWPAYVQGLARISSSTKVVILVKDAKNEGKWKKIGDWSANVGPSKTLVDFTKQLEDLAEHSLETGEFIATVDETSERSNVPYLLSIRLQLLQTEDVCVAAFLLTDTAEEPARETLLRVKLTSDIPRSYQNFQSSVQARTDVQKFATALDLMVEVNSEKRFLAAALALCNGIASRYQCDRVSLGWFERGYARLQAISRTEKFDRQMAAAKALETAMDETLDQDEEIIWPPPENTSLVTRDHERFVHDQRCGHLCSIPLRIDNEAVAVITCEREATPFTQLEVDQFRLCADQATPRLGDLKRHDRWFGARWSAALKEKCGKLVGPEHTWAKVIAVLITVILAILIFFKVPYRVEGNFLLRSDEVSYLTAPFKGFIHEVHVRPGDEVKAGQSLVTLDTSELELQQGSALADLTRYNREADKSRAARELAEMRIAQSQADQSKARLDLVRYRLEQSKIKAPFNGIVVEGDLRERISAPVEQGDALFKVARTDNLYVEAEISERDAHEILGRTDGEIAFVSQPKLKFPVKILTIEPAAFPKKEGNVFLVRCELVGGAEKWWRPGMSGLCKLTVDKRTLLWIFTHRTVDFVRLKLWW